MLTIRIGKKRVKLLNWIIFIFFVILFIYILVQLFFMLPIFKNSYNYSFDGGNYKIVGNVLFKKDLFNCSVIEKYKVESEDEYVEKLVNKDLLSDNFKIKNDVYLRQVRKSGTCKNNLNKYKKIYNDKYVIFKLNGESKKKISYGTKYNEDYVVAKINEKNIKDINVLSDLNENKTGKYFVKYELEVSSNYKLRLYRIVNIVDEEKPLITLNGEDNIELNFKDSFREPGFSASDNYDGDITSKVKVKNDVNTKKPGMYKITYKVSDSNGNADTKVRIVSVKNTVSVNQIKPNIENKNGITYVDGILVVNKKYSLPKDYDPKVNREAFKSLKEMQSDAKVLGLDLSLMSGYRAYKTQKQLFNKYVAKDGEKEANTYSAKPGQSEHQTGLAFDIGSVDRSFANTDEAKWIEENAHLYGFIVRYPKGKTDITGYIYEPWHVRYLGKDTAKSVKESGLTLEEYLGIN